MRIIAGTYKNRVLTAPKGLLTRPTSERLREALFNICQMYIQDASILDLYAGSGAIGIEALSRGAATATMVDNSRECLHVIKENIERFNLEKQAKVYLGDVFEQIQHLQKLGKQFDIIFADPPYDLHVTIKGLTKSALEWLMERIDEGTLLKPMGMLFFEKPSDVLISGENRKTLEFISSRRFGRSFLEHYQKK
jgi:16S rRNA (guanine966-N2)-methyltransferase